MIQLTPQMRILVAVEPVDFRRYALCPVMRLLSSASGRQVPYRREKRAWWRFELLRITIRLLYELPAPWQQEECNDQAKLFDQRNRPFSDSC